MNYDHIRLWRFNIGRFKGAIGHLKRAEFMTYLGIEKGDVFIVNIYVTKINRNA